MSRSGEDTRLPSKHPPASTAGNHGNQSEAPFRTSSTWDVADSETQTNNKDRRLFIVFSSSNRIISSKTFFTKTTSPTQVLLQIPALIEI